MTDGRPRALALMPHPDDAEILCAGTLLRLGRAGFDLHIMTMTAGDLGSPDRPRAEIATIRREEARAGAAVIGATCACLEFDDVRIVFDNPSRERVVAALRRVDPTLVITTAPDDYMFDHIITSQLVRDACFTAPAPNYETAGGERPSSRVPYLYYADCIEGVDMFGVPVPASIIVDITGEIDAKTAALECHQSQRAWLRAQHGMDDYIDTMRRWSARRGAEIGVAFGEAFRQHRGHPYPSDDLLARTLGG
ncbi:MAG: PIG-L family deacetylase [Chthonomonadales bacterium]|nr:PIG-L family deacetylase [Chthonomonadales bacterium]